MYKESTVLTLGSLLVGGGGGSSGEGPPCGDPLLLPVSTVISILWNGRLNLEKQVFTRSVFSML